MRHRRPLNLLVTGLRPKRSADALQAMGATVAIFRPDALVSTIKSPGRRMAVDGIVIDATSSPNALRDTHGVIYATQIATELRRLGDTVLMANGVRWNRVPIVLLVEDDGFATAVTCDPTLEKIDAVSLMAGWDAVYGFIDTVTYRAALVVAGDMERVGWMLHEMDDALIRAGSPDLRRRHGERPDIETDTYDLRGDDVYRTWNPNGRWWGRDVVVRGSDLTARELKRAHEILESLKHPEQHLQVLVEQAPYFLEAMPHELYRHPYFVSERDGREYIVDFAKWRFGDPTIDLVELKTLQMRTFRRNGPYFAATSAMSSGSGQVTRYKFEFEHEANASHVRRILGGIPREVRKHLVAGDTRGVDPAILAEQRDMLGVNWVGVNDVLEGASNRLTS